VNSSSFLDTEQNKSVSKPKSIHKLKDEAQDIKEIALVMKNFEYCWKQIMKLHVKEQFDDLNEDEQLEINKAMSALHNVQKDILLKEQVTDGIKTLSHSLALLKISQATKDYDVTEVHVTKFLKHKTFGIHALVDASKDFENNIKSIRTNYNSLINAISVTMPLESKVKVIDNDPLNHIKELQNIHGKQKELLCHIGNNFTSIVRELMKNKTCKKVLSKLK